MKKISLLSLIVFHISNIGMIALYLFPGSILGWLIYDNLQKQPQITPNFFISTNHLCAFMVLSFLGLISFNSNKFKILFSYLFTISIILELCHILIPKRSFEYSDLFGNFLGVFFIFVLYNLYKFLKDIK